jgi:HEAT repeat protein
MIRVLMLAAVLATSVETQNLLADEAYAVDAQASAHDDADYQAGMADLDSHQWDQAVAAFNTSASKKKSNADAALYWKAYAQNRSGRRDAALTTLNQLREQYPSSKWLKDASALNLEVRAQGGDPVSPSQESDDDLKLMAVNSLMQSDPNTALPVIEKVLAGHNSDKLKERALFVLAQNPSPAALKLMGNIANGNSGSDLQVKAVRFIGMTGGEESRKQLDSVYASTQDTRVKKAILQGYMQSGSRDALLKIAKAETDPQLRRDAIRQLAMTGAEDQLWALYQTDKSFDDRKSILESLFMSGKSGRLLEVAKSDSSPELRSIAVRSLGMMGDKGQADQLVSIFETDKDPAVRKSILNALFIQQNGKALVALARREKDPSMKKEIVSKMSLVQSKDVTDYMMELLK